MATKLGYGLGSTAMWRWPCWPIVTLRYVRTMDRTLPNTRTPTTGKTTDRRNRQDRLGGFPPQQSQSLASPRRLVLERLFAQVIEDLIRTPDRPP